MNKHRIIIAGSRDFTDYETVLKHFRYLVRDLSIDEIEIVSGACFVWGSPVTFVREDNSEVCGADGLGERLAKDLGIPVKLFFADWGAYGKSAGPIRNSAMARYATHCLIFGEGKGSKDMEEKSIKKGLIGETITTTV